ncbi:helix-turn-helix transcriptional regulator [Aminobacter carboxidus]|nr:AraC family transcriptional regulator [Aminobacter carboxidus]
MPILFSRMVPDLTYASNRLASVPGLWFGSAPEAVAALSTRYRPHRLLLADTKAGLDFRHHAIVCEGASLNLLRYGPELVVDAGTFDTFYMLEFPLSGGVDIQYGDRRVSSRLGSGLVLSPGSHIRSTWRADTTQVMLRLERNFVEQAWQRHTNEARRRTPIFQAELDLEASAGRRIARLIGMMVEEKIEAGCAAALSPMPLVNAVLATLFEHVPVKAVATVESVAAGPVPAYVRDFRRLLDAPSYLPLTVAELAAELDVSTRTLTTGMRRFTGYSPHDYLTMRRMEHARKLLDQGGISIMQVAERVGYANAGRFAASFRAYCGVNPSRLCEHDSR